MTELLKNIAQKIEDEEPLTLEEAKQFKDNCILVSHEKREEMFVDREGIPKSALVMQYIKIKFLDKDYYLEYNTPVILTDMSVLRDIYIHQLSLTYQACFAVADEKGDLLSAQKVIEEYFSCYLKEVDIAPFQEKKERALKEMVLRQEDLENTLKDKKNWTFNYQINFGYINNTGFIQNEKDYIEFTENDKDYSKLFYFFNQAYEWDFYVKMTAHYDNGLFDYEMTIEKKFKFVGDRPNIEPTEYKSFMIFINRQLDSSDELSYEDLKNNENIPWIENKMENPYFLFYSYEKYLKKMNLRKVCSEIIKHYAETYNEQHKIVVLLKENGLEDTVKNIYTELTEIIKCEENFLPRFVLLIGSRSDVFNCLYKIVRKHIDVFLEDSKKELNDRVLFHGVFVYVKKLLSYDIDRITKKIQYQSLRLMNEYNDEY